MAVYSHLLVARNRYSNQLISGKPRLYWVFISGTMLAYIQAAISATLPAIQAIGWRFFYVAKPTRHMTTARYNFARLPPLQAPFLEFRSEPS